MIRIVVAVACAWMSTGWPGSQRAMVASAARTKTGACASTARSQPATLAHRCGSEIRGDGPPLLAPERAVGGQQAAAYHRSEQTFHNPRLLVIGGIVEQHPLDVLGLERHVDPEPRHLPAHVGGRICLLRPAKDGIARPLTEEPPPHRHRPRSTRRIRRDEAAGHSAASSRSALPRSTLTRRLTPFSTIVTPNRRCIRLIVTALCVTIR